MPKLKTILTNNAFFNMLKPKRYLRSIHDINLEILKEKGIKALIVDLDDTLVPRIENKIPALTTEWVKKVKKHGLKLHIVSNGRKLKRLVHVARYLEIGGSGLGFKPFPFTFLRVLKKLKTRPNETAVIGDLLTTDVLGGNILGMYTILVKPMTKETSIIRIPYRIFEEKMIKLLGIRITP